MINITIMIMMMMMMMMMMIIIIIIIIIIINALMGSRANKSPNLADVSKNTLQENRSCGTQSHRASDQSGDLYSCTDRKGIEVREESMRLRI